MSGDIAHLRPTMGGVCQESEFCPQGERKETARGTRLAAESLASNYRFRYPSEERAKSVLKGEQMSHISRRHLVLMLIGLDEDGSIGDSVGGITRLQKLLYLLEKEGHLTPSGDGFDFSAYKAGPYSSKLYDDLEFLENLDFLESEVEAETTDAETAEVDLLDFDELMGTDDDEGPASADAYEERRFQVTEKGMGHIESMLSSGDYEPIAEGIRKIKSKYGHHSLNDLLYHVYTKYPDMTTESEIKDKVLSRRPRKK